MRQFAIFVQEGRAKNESRDPPQNTPRERLKGKQSRLITVVALATCNCSAERVKSVFSDFPLNVLTVSLGSTKILLT